jgi:hypothetical protein
MAATLRTYFAVFMDLAGRTLGFGDLQKPLSETTVPGTDFRAESIITVPAASSVKLYEQTQMPDFKLLALVPSADCQVGLHVDTVTSSTNPAASGTNPRGRVLDLFANLPFLFHGPTARVNPTLATDAGVSSGVPSIFASGTTVAGRIYTITIFNPGTTAMTVRRIILN